MIDYSRQAELMASVPGGCAVNVKFHGVPTAQTDRAAFRSAFAAGLVGGDAGPDRPWSVCWRRSVDVRQGIDHPLWVPTLLRQSFPSKDAAEAYVADRESDPRRGLYIAPNKVTLDDMWPRWPGAKSQLGRTTLAGYDAAWKRDIEPKWASTPLAEIDRASVMEWLPTLRTKSKRELSPSWSRKVAITMRGLLDMGVDARLIPVNPLQRLGKALPQQKASERRYLSVAEVDALIAAMGDNALPVRVLIMSGIRRGAA
jgi:hypothetical protein